jgi:dihydroorotate dehydrogenase electron transfer subunit
MSIRHAHLKLCENRELGAGLFLLRFTLPAGMKGHFQAGQFLQLSLPGFTLPRPFSILTADDDGLTILVKVLGGATRELGSLSFGSPVACSWPLGRSFADLLHGDEILILVGGGVGIAPLIAAFEQMAERCDQVLFGFRDEAQYTASLKICPESMPLEVSTEDGSHGHDGRVTALLEKALATPGRTVLCCGPDPMMRAVADLCHKAGSRCILSLETYMGCGVGICAGCAVPQKDGRMALCCKEGPVFDAADLLETLA